MSGALETKPTGMPEIDGNAFQVTIRMHTNDAQKALSDPGTVRQIFGEALDMLAGRDVLLQEEVDYTLEVHRVYRCAP